MFETGFKTFFPNQQAPKESSKKKQHVRTASNIMVSEPKEQDTSHAVSRYFHEQYDDDISEIKRLSQVP